jgi:hypothetical protein
MTDAIYLLLLVALFGVAAALIPAFARLIDRQDGGRK